MPLWEFCPIFQGDILTQRVHFNFSFENENKQQQKNSICYRTHHHTEFVYPHITH